MAAEMATTGWTLAKSDAQLGGDCATTGHQRPGWPAAGQGRQGAGARGAAGTHPFSRPRLCGR